MTETATSHFGPSVAMAYCTVYESHKLGAFPTLCATSEHVYLCIGTDTYFGVMTGFGPPTDYGMGAATGEIRITGK